MSLSIERNARIIHENGHCYVVTDCEIKDGDVMVLDTEKGKVYRVVASSDESLENVVKIGKGYEKAVKAYCKETGIELQWELSRLLKKYSELTGNKFELTSNAQQFIRQKSEYLAKQSMKEATSTYRYYNKKDVEKAFSDGLYDVCFEIINKEYNNE